MTPTGIAFNLPPLAMMVWSNDFNQWWSSPTLIGYSFFVWLIFICLVLEALIWVGFLVLYIARRLLGSGSVDLKDQEIPKPQNVLFGNFLWKTHLP